MQKLAFVESLHESALITNLSAQREGLVMRTAIDSSEEIVLQFSNAQTLKLSKFHWVIEISNCYSASPT